MDDLLVGFIVIVKSYLLVGGGIDAVRCCLMVCVELAEQLMQK